MTPKQSPVDRAAAFAMAVLPDGTTDAWLSVLTALDGAYAPVTIAEHIKNFGMFARWCNEHGKSPAPATVDTVSDHVSEVFQHCGKRHVQARMATIRRVHILLGLPDPTRTLAVELAYRRGLRRHGLPSRQARGLTTSLRDRLLAVCPGTILGLRDRAMISVGYDTLCRRSELVGLRIEDVTRLADGSASVLVRRSKTDPFGRGGVAYMSRHAVSDLDAWLAGAELSAGPILRPIFKTVAGPRPLHPRTVNRRIRELATMAGIEAAVVERLTSHSFRVGAAQDLAASGRTLMEIMRAGRWQNVDAVAHYVREAPINVWAERAEKPRS